MTNIVDVETVEVPKANLYGEGISDKLTETTFTVPQEETTEDIQKQNMADFAKFFDSLNRNKKRKIMRNRIRCKRLHPRVGTKKWVRQQITNRLSQCK